jgi:anti-sigma factor RsiW
MQFEKGWTYMKTIPSPEHLEDAVILAYLDGELSRAAARKVTHHLQSCWNCRSAAAELELLAQTAYALLSGKEEADAQRLKTARAEFFRRKASIDATWNKEPRRGVFLLNQQSLSAIGRGTLQETRFLIAI